MVDSIAGDRVVGRIWSDVLILTGFRRGQRYEFGEGELVDWMVARPDGTEEGNVVGVFMDSYRPPDCSDSKAPEELPALGDGALAREY